MTDPDLPGFDAEVELVHSKLNLETKFDRKISTYVYPYSKVKGEMFSKIGEHYRFGRAGWVDDPNSFIFKSNRDDRFSIPCFTIKYWEVEDFKNLLRLFSDSDGDAVCLGLHLVCDDSSMDSSYPWRITTRDLDSVFNLCSILNIEIESIEDVL